MEFVICDDDEFVRDKIIYIINTLTIEGDDDYKIKVFNDFDDSFMSYIKSNKSLKVYILDIETPTLSGIDVAKIIRKDDLDSYIIFVTSHNEFGQLVLRKDLMCTAYINKFEEMEKRLVNTLRNIKECKLSNSILKISDRNTIYNISKRTILYLVRDSVERKTIICTDDRTYKINKPLIELKNTLNNNFVQTHKSCIVNKDRVTSFCFKNGIITFDNRKTIDYLSKKYRKDL